MTSPARPNEEDDVLAGEYVLGVLDLSDRMAVEARLKTDLRFGELVGRWENQLAALNAGYADMKAPNVLAKVEARLFPAPPPVKAPTGFSWFHFISGVVTAAVMVLALILTLPSPRITVASGRLMAADQSLGFEADFDGNTLLLTRLVGEDAPAGKDYELWIILGDKPPKSLGLIPSAATIRNLDSVPEGAVLAVSLEPDGGSITGQPTGPILLQGKMTL